MNMGYLKYSKHMNIIIENIKIIFYIPKILYFTMDDMINMDINKIYYV